MGNTDIIHIGVFIPLDSQLLDMACIDVFGTMSKEYLSILPDLPAHVAEAAPSVKISYITSTENFNAGRIPLTAGAHLTPTHDMKHPDVQPGKLDMVLVPGPDPNKTIDEEAADWLRAQMKPDDTIILSVCTGIFVFAQAGLLDGRQVCGPRGLQDQLRKQYPKGNFVGEDLRWTNDGNFWSCGGITNGLDLAAEVARKTDLFPAPVAELGIKLCEVGDRPQRYEQGKSAMTLGFVWQILKAYFVGSGGRKSKSKSS